MISTKTLSTALAASVGLAMAGGAISPVQAATLGGGTCSVLEVTITGHGSADNCAGFFSGNDKGRNDPAITLLNNGLFGDFGSWSLTGTDDDFRNGNGQSFDDVKEKSGVWNFAKGFSGPAAVAVKAGNSYSLYFFADVAQAFAGTFDTSGVRANGGGAPALSHLSVFTAQRPDMPPTPQPVPEPASILSLLALGGLTIGLKRRN